MQSVWPADERNGKAGSRRRGRPSQQDVSMREVTKRSSRCVCSAGCAGPDSLARLYRALSVFRPCHLALLLELVHDQSRSQPNVRHKPNAVRGCTELPPATPRGPVQGRLAAHLRCVPHGRVTALRRERAGEPPPTPAVVPGGLANVRRQLIGPRRVQGPAHAVPAQKVRQRRGAHGSALLGPHACPTPSEPIGPGGVVFEDSAQ